MNAATETTSGVHRDGGVSIFRGLLWRHWLVGRWLVLAGLIVLLTCGWSLMLFHHPGWIIATGSLFALIAGTVFGGTDAAEGSEEFAFALPPTRSQRYVSGIVIGGGVVLAYCLVGALSIALDLPQLLWSLVVDSGFTAPFGPWGRTFLCPLAIVVPLMAFAATYVPASLSRTSTGVWLSWLSGVVFTGGSVWIACSAELMVWRDVNGYVGLPGLGALAVMILLLGHARYMRKEGISRPGQSAAKGGSWWIWVVMGVFVLLVMMFVLYHIRSDEAVEHMESAKENAEAARATARSRDTESRPQPSVGTTMPASSPATRVSGDAAVPPHGEELARPEVSAGGTGGMSAGSTPVMGIPLVLLLVIVLVAIAVLVRSRGARPMRLRAPRKRHIVTRLVCGALGVAILAAIGFVSWREATAVYAVSPAGPGSIRVRTKTPREFSGDITPDRDVSLKEARLLIQAVILDTAAGDSFTAIHVDEFDIRWRRGRGNRVATSVDIEGGTVDYSLDISDLRLERGKTTGTPTLRGSGVRNVTYRSRNGTGYSSRSGGVPIVDGLACSADFRSGSLMRANEPLSVISSGSPHGALVLCTFVHLVDPDDKLATTSISQFLADRQRQIARYLSEAGVSDYHWRSRWRIDPDVPPMGALVERIGVSSLLLLVAAILLSQLFMRRGLAMMGMLTMVVLYVAAIDRVALSVHVSHLQDADGPLAKRLAACRSAAETFFFAGTASSQLKAVADDENNPQALRRQAGTLSILLGATADTSRSSAEILDGTWQSISLSVPGPSKDGQQPLRWDIKYCRRRGTGKPLMVVVHVLPVRLRSQRLGRRMLGKVAVSQVDAAGRIVIVGPSLRAFVVGDSADMEQAAWACRSPDILSSEVWDRLIRPAAEAVVAGKRP